MAKRKKSSISELEAVRKNSLKEGIAEMKKSKATNDFVNKGVGDKSASAYERARANAPRPSKRNVNKHVDETPRPYTMREILSPKSKMGSSKSVLDNKPRTKHKYVD